MVPNSSRILLRAAARVSSYEWAIRARSEAWGLIVICQLSAGCEWHAGHVIWP